MKNSNLKKALSKLSLNSDIEVINPETVKGGTASRADGCFIFIIRRDSALQ